MKCTTDFNGLGDSGILLAVPSRRICVLAFGMLLAFARIPAAQGQATPVQVAAQAAIPLPAPTNSSPAPVVPAPQKSLNIVVLDPAHGGADQGARGSTGITESDVTLGMARLLRISLEAQGLRVILTRQGNENPSFDERSKIANAQRGAIFLTLHVSSTGQPGTVRVYSEVAEGDATAARSGLISWDHAQAGYLDSSRQLAELLQVQMAQHLHGSPETPLTAPVRQLRTIAAPAVAIEISSVSLPDRSQLDQMAPALADAVARAVVAFRTVYDSGGK